MTQEAFLRGTFILSKKKKESKVWDIACLINIRNSRISVKYAVEWLDLETLSYVLLETILKISTSVMKKLRNFTLTWSNEGKMNDKPCHITYSKEFKNLDNPWQGMPAPSPHNFLEQNFFLRKIREHAHLSVTESFLLGFSWSSDNITPSNKKNTSKSLPMHLR